jgi:hypothetical protein
MSGGTPPPPPSSCASSLAAAALALIWTLVLFVPWKPQFVGALPIDARSTTASWQLALNEIHAQGLRFGDDVVFNYGPWGFVMTRVYHPATRALMVLAWVAVSLIFFAAAWSIAISRFGPWRALGWTIALCAVASFCFELETVFYLLAPLLLFHHFYFNRAATSVLTILLAVGLAFTGLSKFSHQILASIVILLIAIDDLRRRRIPWIALAYLLAIPTLWMLSGQRLGGLRPYFVYSWRLSAAYSEAMALTPPGAIWAAAGFLVVAMLLMVQASTREGPDGRVRRTLFLLGLGAVLFTAFKAANVRADYTHLVAGFSLLAAVSMICQATFRNSLFTTLLSAAGGLLAVFLLCNGFASSSPDPHGPQRGDASSEQFYHQCLSAIRSECPLPVAGGSTDAYPGNQALVIANDRTFNPRPLLQSYIAFTPELAAFNARHLSGESSPQSILFSIHPLDNRYPTFDDGFSWLPLLSHYEPGEARGDFVMLKRRSKARSLRLQPIEDVTVPIGTRIDIASAASTLIWAEIDLPGTVLGSIAKTLYKSPELRMNVKLANGTSHDYRFIPSIARGGFLLSPLIQNARSMAALEPGTLNGTLSGAAIATMVIEPDGGLAAHLCYGHACRIRLYRIEAERF